MTATPLQNCVQDMFSVFRFLRYAPFCDEAEWEKLFERPRDGVRRLQPVLQAVMIRRTKTDTDADGAPLIRLPPKHMDVYKLKFRDDDEREYAQMKRDCYKALNFNKSQFLVGLLRLRQACNCMPSRERQPDDRTVTESDQDRGLSTALDQLSIGATASVPNPESELSAALDGLAISSGRDTATEADTAPALTESVCGACSDLIPAQMMVADLCHQLCRDCTHGALNDTGKCPVCGKKIRIGSAPPPPASDSAAPAPAGDLARFRSSPKMEFLLRHLERIRAKDEKAVVFSQWTQMLDLMGACLDADDVCWVRLDGTMSRGDRQAAVASFRCDATVTVFLLSLKCAGVGLNLTTANHCFMMDTWWNFCIEDQAFGRIYRIGQAKPVHIYRLVMAGSIEEKVLDLQRRKQDLADTLLVGSGRASPKPLSLDDLRSLLLR